MRISAFELIFGFSRALDLVKPQLAGHHLGVAWLADAMSRSLALPTERRWQIFVAAMLHDAGAIPLKINTDDLVFERETWQHCRAGWALLSRCAFLAPMASLVLFHHTAWNKLRDGDPALFPANIIHLADSVELFLRDRKWSMKRSDLKRHFSRSVGRKFRPRYVESLRECCFREDDMFRLPSARAMEQDLRAQFAHLVLKPDQLMQFCFLFSLITDFLSPFTATHTAGVAHTACILHRKHMLRTTAQVDAKENRMFFVAGLLHDIGKLGVPCDILEKEGPLDHDEFTRIKRHAELSLSLLDNIPGLEEVRLWGALHHERLNGKGYPLGLRGDQISLPSRIMAVADVFTALMEDRPYRRGMSLDKAFEILQSMEDNGHLDGNVLTTLRSAAGQINKVRIAAQHRARRRFDELYRLCAEPVENNVRLENAKVHALNFA